MCVCSRSQAVVSESEAFGKELDDDRKVLKAHYDNVLASISKEMRPVPPHRLLLITNKLFIRRTACFASPSRDGP